MTRRLLHSVPVRRSAQVAIDAGLVATAFLAAFALRFDAGIPGRYEELLLQTAPFVVVGKLLVFALFGLYNKLWRFVDARDFEAVVRAVVVSSLLLVGVLFLLSPGSVAPPRGVIALDFLLTLLTVAGSRFVVRTVGDRRLTGGEA